MFGGGLTELTTPVKKFRVPKMRYNYRPFRNMLQECYSASALSNKFTVAYHFLATTDAFPLCGFLQNSVMVSPTEILDRTEACRALGVSRQTLISWIRKGKLKVWKRAGHGSNAAVLFERKDIECLRQAQD